MADSMGEAPHTQYALPSTYADHIYVPSTRVSRHIDITFGVIIGPPSHQSWLGLNRVAIVPLRPQLAVGEVSIMGAVLLSLTYSQHPPSSITGLNPSAFATQ